MSYDRVKTAALESETGNVLFIAPTCYYVCPLPGDLHARSQLLFETSRMSVEMIHWHTLHPRFLGPNSRVLDLGANYGLFSRFMVERFGCECVAIEPSPVPFQGIRTNDRISKRQIAIVPEPGDVSFHIRSESVSSSIYQLDTHQHLDTITVPGVTLEQLLQELGWSELDLLKSDIEGAEIQVLEATSDDCLRRIKQISVEFHDFSRITPAKQVEATIRRLERLGFSSVRMSRIGHQDTWLINRKLCPLSTSEFLYIKYAVRNWLGLRRVVDRMVARPT